jgi:cardiolipin synthase
MELLVGADAFWTRLDADIRAASLEVCIQMMTFEGDSVGHRVEDALLTVPHARRRILVDEFTRYVVSDKFRYTPGAFLDPDHRREVAATRLMFERLEREGAQVRFTSPVGPLFVRFPARNHKKLVLVDRRIAYFGGFNFSDHNFAWHDLMVRCDDATIAEFLHADFDATWDGRARLIRGSFPQCDVHALDGVTNEEGFRPILDLFRHARRSITVVSPYLTFPFCEALENACRRGVHVTLVTPLDNNKRIVRDYLLWRAARAGFDVRLYRGMSHMKAALVDDEKLVLGSSNFDFASYRIEPEIVVVVSAPDVIASFRRQVLDRDLPSCTPLDRAPSTLHGVASLFALKAADAASVLARRLGGS